MVISGTVFQDRMSREQVQCQST